MDNDEKKQLENQLDLKLIDQLHSVVLQISNFCFEVKKFCISILFTVIGIILTVTDKKLDHSIFFAGIIIPLSFWGLDSIGYYYQTKLRQQMGKISHKLLNSNGTTLISSNLYQSIPLKIEGKEKVSVSESFFNHSMWMYFILIMISIVCWLLFHFKIILK